VTRVLLRSAETTADIRKDSGECEDFHFPQRAAAAAAEPAADADVERLQRKVDVLARLAEEKDQTIATLSQRLEHSLRMLRAVHTMYEQQQKVFPAPISDSETHPGFFTP